MVVELLNFGKDSPQPTPPPSPEKKPKITGEKASEALPAIGEKIEKEFTTPHEKAILAGEFQKIFKEKFSQFSKDFQAKYSDKSGQPDFPKILSLYNLDKVFGPTFPKESETDKLLSFGASKDISPESSGKIPENPGSMTGTKFLESLNQLGNMNSKENQRKMEMLIMAEVAKGNIPSFCRPENGKTVAMKGADGTVVKFKAGLDYLAVGTDKNFIRVPITPVLAQTLSKQYGWGLPTGEMTDAIYASADKKLRGIGLVNTEEDQMYMQGNAFVEKHNAKINEMLGPDGLTRLHDGKYLVAGHKKDVIISSTVVGNPNGPLDYRGLYIDGKNPIQKEPAHEWSYRDYSHGYRAIAGNVIVAYPDGRTETRPYYEALKDPAIAKVLNGAQGAFNAEMAYVDPKKISKDKKSA